MKKLFLCIGAAKTGTTWLYRNIRANPGLRFTPEKELDYFFTRYGRFDRLTPEIRAGKRARREAAKGRIEWYDRYTGGAIDDDWYRALFAETPEGCWACDFSPSTSLIREEGWKAVSRFAPEIRVVYILREPLERLWSHAKFHAAVMGEFDKFRETPVRGMHRLIDRFKLTEDGDYGSNLARLLAYIPRERVLLLDYADIARAPQEVLRRVEAHLGLGETPDLGGRLEERVNVTESLSRPKRFGAPYFGRFRRETRLLADLDVAFARPWAERYERESRLPRRLARTIGV